MMRDRENCLLAKFKSHNKLVLALVYFADPKIYSAKFG